MAQGSKKIKMAKILTCCKQGLVRSVGLADVLKLHFRPVDVIPIGLESNFPGTLKMLFGWANHIIVMEEQYKGRIWTLYSHKALVCEVGPDTYGNSHNRSLIDQCWDWCRKNKEKLGIKEHGDSI